MNCATAYCANRSFGGSDRQQGAPDQGVHTLNSDDRFEVIDAVGQMTRAHRFGGRDTE